MPELLTAYRIEPDGDMEAEPVEALLEGPNAVFVLDDGTRLVFDRRELAEALAERESERRVA